MADQTGTLYGIGVGPGDPGLITVRAAAVLSGIPHVFTASSSGNDHSIALDIARPHLGHAEITQLPFPMTRVEAVVEKALVDNARRIVSILKTGKDAAFLTLGDPLTYSTFGRLLIPLRRLLPEAKILTIPGITSYHAAAASLDLPLVQEEESFTVLSGAAGAERLKDAVKTSDTVVVLKVYRHAARILAALEELGLVEHAILVSRCGLDGERIVRDASALRDNSLSYLSLLIVRRPRQSP